MDTGLDGRVAMVAGGTRGLGGAVACALLDEGARVSICGRDHDAVNQAVHALGSDRVAGLVHGCALDVRDEDAIQRWVDEVVARYGRLDVVVANAGGPPGGHATQFRAADYREALELSLISSITLAQAAIPHLVARGWGRLLFITSISVKQPVERLALSNTARPGVVGFARSLVQELGAGQITVNVLAPGITRTARLDELVEDPEALAADVPLGRLGSPSEFAAAAVFLASEAASYVTGVVLPVDGGLARSLL